MKEWSTEEMKVKPGSLLEGDTEEIREWRHMSQEEMDQCWKKLAAKMEEEVLDKYKVEEGVQRQRLLLGMEACTKKQDVQDTKLERRLLGKDLFLFQRVQGATHTKYA